MVKQILSTLNSTISNWWILNLITILTTTTTATSILIFFQLPPPNLPHNNLIQIVNKPANNPTIILIHQKMKLTKFPPQISPIFSTSSSFHIPSSSNNFSNLSQMETQMLLRNSLLLLLLPSKFPTKFTMTKWMFKTMVTLFNTQINWVKIIQ